MSSSGFIIPADWPDHLYAISRAAGEVVLGYYQRSDVPEVTRKMDDSPLTAADLASNDCLISALSDMQPRLPIVSEESDPRHFVVPQGARYWLIDPLDGTREFIERTGEFTINIALIEGDRTIFGVVYAPSSGDFFCGGRGIAPFVMRDGQRSPIACRALPEDIIAAVSRRRAKAAMDFLASASLVAQCGVSTVTLGSALKFTHVAEGLADIYPCLGPTGEWDSAAGQAIMEAAGGAVVDLQGQPLRYGRNPDRINPSFVVLGDAGAWRRAGDIGA
ncbi:MAG TPA: 3'(2'),5'-bisphosphate nucleotidase CysQ [Pseudomonadales bacterium]|nr:3'(2'),5'-bisphosphate nucleotidase CysQ [Pseudomonadales bacterium]